jgi:hypothetical protein
MEEEAGRLQAQLGLCSVALAACQSDVAKEVAELLVKEPAMWTLVALVAAGLLLWFWRVVWYVRGYQAAFPPDRYSYNLK